MRVLSSYHDGPHKHSREYVNFSSFPPFLYSFTPSPPSLRTCPWGSVQKRCFRPSLRKPIGEEDDDSNDDDDDDDEMDTEEEEEEDDKEEEEQGNASRYTTWSSEAKRRLTVEMGPRLRPWERADLCARRSNAARAGAERSAVMGGGTWVRIRIMEEGRKEGMEGWWMGAYPRRASRGDGQ